MAENMDPNDLRAVSDAMNELRETGTLTAESLKKLSGAGKESADAQKKFSNDLVQYSRQVSGAVSSLAGGGGSFKSLAGSVDVTATAISKVAGQFGTVGKVIGGLATGLAEAAKIVLNQLDFMAENYNTLGSASAGAVDGIDGLARQFEAIGNYSLPAFTKAVKANALGLNAFRGTTARGAEELSKVAGALTTGDAAGKFIKLGISLDEVGNTTTSYIANYSRLGLLQSQTTQELTKKTQDYIEEVDKIARLTGQTREQQQSEQAKTLADVRSRAELSKMRNRGDTEAAEQLELLMKSFDAATNSAVRATATGIPLTKQAQSFSVFTRDEIRQTILAVKRREIDAVQGAARINKALAAGADTFGDILSFSGEVFEGAALSGFDAQSRELALVKLRQEAEYKGLSDAEIIAAEQKRTEEASGDATNKYARATVAAADANKNLNKITMKLALDGVGAIESFADGLRNVTEYLNDHFGIASSRKEREQDLKNWDKMTAAEKAISGVARGIEKVGSALGLDTFAKNAEKSRIESESTALESRKASVSPDAARAKAESYYGKKISDDEYSALVKATHAEAAAGKQASQKEQAMIMASILNRARTDEKGIIGALTAKNQFQSVTGTAADGHQPSKQFLTGPDKDRLKSIEGATDFLDKISKEQKNFTAASAAAYGPGTDIGYRDKMLASGGQVVGGTVFQTKINDKIDQQLAAMDKQTAQIQAQADNNRKKSNYTTPASDSYKSQLGDLDREAQAARDKLARTTAGPLNDYRSQLTGLNPSKTLSEKSAAETKTVGAPATEDTAHIDILHKIHGSLEQLTQYNQVIASSNQKIQKQTQ